MTMHWFPKATSEPPPAPPAPPAITEGSSRGNMKREHFREMPKGPPPALQPQPTLTDEERAALTWFAHYGLPEHRAAALRNLLERLS